MRSYFILLFICLLAACGSSTGDSTPANDCPTCDSSDSSVGIDTGTETGEDVEAPQQDTQAPPGDSLTDSADTGTAPDTGVPMDTGSAVDVEPGSKQLGEPCALGGECASGLCWASSRGSGCTIACDSQAECQQYALVCTWLEGEVKACSPPPASARGTCAGNQDCQFPYVCVTAFGWCELPACTWDGDCAAPDQICQEAARQCQPLTCQSTIECKHPLEFCLDGTCSPPECTQRSDCDAGQICHPTQGICDDATPCTDSCDYYNQMCVDGLCEPNLCTSPCSDSNHICNPATGICGAACSSSSQCGPGMACDTTQGVCFTNQAPLAVARIELGSALLPAVTFTTATPIQLDGSLSVDPDKEPLVYLWQLKEVPVGVSLTAGDMLADTSPRPLFTPPAPGLYVFGLWVKDPSGLVSPQAEATAFILSE